VLDVDGEGTGFTSRLAGTAMPGGADALLDIDTGLGEVAITSTQSDFNGGAGVGIMTAPGVQLSSLGYDGSQSFSATANFGPITGFEDIDQVGLYIGTDAANLTRSGMIVFGGGSEFFSGHTTAGADNNGRFFGFGLDVSDGMEVTISRTAGDWEYFIDGNPWHPNTAGDGSGTLVDPDGSNGSPDLDSLSDLTVGVYAITPLNANPKVWPLDSFSVTVVPEPSSLSLLLVSLGGFLATRRKRD